LSSILPYGNAQPELDYLTNILNNFHELFGNTAWKNEDQVKQLIKGIPASVAKDKAYQNAMNNSDKQNARIESDKAVNRVVTDLLVDNTELFKQFSDSPSFKRWLTDMVFNLTYNTNGEVFGEEPRV
jgi:type I restriction enzyme R subunit